MRALHFDCFSGISGDMTLAALLDAGVDTAAVPAGLDSLGLPLRLHVEKIAREDSRPPLFASRFPRRTNTVICPTSRRSLAVASSRRDNLTWRGASFPGWLPPRRRFTASPVDKVHFHEVGALDSIADIAGVAIALDLLGAAITSRLVPVGSGTVNARTA